MCEEKKKCNSLLDYCRYYKGEKESPHNKPMQSLVWRFEKDWFDDNVKCHKEDNLIERMRRNITTYLDEEMAKFEEYDDVPLTLKSYLYALHLKGNEMPLKEDFKQFYYQWRNHTL